MLKKVFDLFLFSQFVFSLSDIKLSSGKITFHNFPWKIFAKVQCCVVLRCNGVTKLETCSSLTWSYNSLEYKYFLYTAIKIFLGACVWIFLMHKITDLYYSYRDTTFSFACDTCTLVGGSSTFTFTFTLNKMIKKATICIVWWFLGLKCIVFFFSSRIKYFYLKDGSLPVRVTEQRMVSF